MLARRVAARYAHAQVQVPVPIIPQSFDFSCGSATTFSALSYWLGENLGKIETESDLWAGLQMDVEDGAEAERIAAVARHFGLKADVAVNLTPRHLEAAIQRGTTTILCLQAWQEEPAPYVYDYDHGHYILAVGYDAENFTFMDPALHTSYGWMPKGELPSRWHSPDSNNRPVQGLGIIISGETPMGAFPALPQRIK